jgi:hypothetical protein
MVVDSGETTAQAETRKSSADARIVRKAVPVDAPPAYSALMQCRVQVVDGSALNEIRGPIPRAAVRVYDHSPFPGEIFQQTGANRLHYLPHGGGVVVGGHTYQNIRLADVNQLAKKLIRKNALFGQILSPFNSFPLNTL